MPVLVSAELLEMTDDDLFHRKVFGHLGKGVYTGWRAAGHVLRVGEGAAHWAIFSWDAQWAREHPDETSTANPLPLRIRLNAALRNVRHAP